MPILRDPLSLKEPSSPARLRRAMGGKMLANIEILIVDIKLIGGARGCGQTGFALRFMYIFLGEICIGFLCEAYLKFLRGLGNLIQYITRTPCLARSRLHQIGLD